MKPSSVFIFGNHIPLPVFHKSGHRNTFFQKMRTHYRFCLRVIHFILAGILNDIFLIFAGNKICQRTCAVIRHFHTVDFNPIQLIYPKLKLFKCKLR